MRRLTIIQLALALGALCCTVLGHAGGGEASFTPISVLIPLRAVYISDAGHNNVGALYECGGGSNDACLIDLTNQLQLQGVLGNPSRIPAAEYSKITVQNCKGE